MKNENIETALEKIFDTPELLEKFKQVKSLKEMYEIAKSVQSWEMKIVQSKILVLTTIFYILFLFC
ncbi:hypothetical protein FACS189465_1180 [Clostridia bacterium]|nr:hypothetical protein FACS189465_1180 [Clostridia bacterium]